ncbi:nuclear transport factor 2 family protein [Sciscionella marina]|uniref:nuclear transport factor 2 family protein n=1 Tax=Sciscionella marina TaxID=508770 RepID=UPI00037CD740|nr:nuclear transport factor 2 family protein [Sciscionella marina]
MSNTPNAGQVLRNCVELLEQGQFTEAIERYYADDVVVEHAFGIADPSRWEGKRALLEHLANAGPSTAREFHVRNVVLYEGADPEVAIVEWDTEGVSAVGKPFKAANLLVARVRGGRIVHSRDYHDHLRLAAANDALPGLVEALS